MQCLSLSPWSIFEPSLCRPSRVWHMESCALTPSQHLSYRTCHIISMCFFFGLKLASPSFFCIALGETQKALLGITSNGLSASPFVSVSLKLPSNLFSLSPSLSMEGFTCNEIAVKGKVLSFPCCLFVVPGTQPGRSPDSEWDSSIISGS